MFDEIKTAYAFGAMKSEEDKKKDSIKYAKVMVIVGALVAVSIDFYIGVGLMAGAGIVYVLKK